MEKKKVQPFFTPEIQQLLKEIAERAMPIAKKMDEYDLKNEETYHALFEAMKGYLSKNGYILPVDQKDFFDWFWFEKNAFQPFSIAAIEEMAAMLTPSIFREFSEFQEVKFGYKKGKSTPPPPPKDLPSFEKVLQVPERLPFLWKHLVEKQNKSTRNTDLFDYEGYVGGLERSASVLMAVTDGLRLCGQIKEGYTEGDVYTILCNRYNATPTKQRSKTRTRAIYKDVKDWVMDFYGR